MNTTLPWALSAVLGTVLVVVLAQEREPAAPPRDAAASCALDECTRLRREVARMENDTGGLRIELDRLRHMLQVKRSNDETLVALGEDKLSDEEKKARLKQALDRMPALMEALPRGETETFRELREVNRAMLLASMDDATPFRELWERSADPLLRSWIVPHIVSRDPANAKTFLLDALESAEDPLLRTELVTALSNYVPDAKDDPAVQAVYRASLGEGLEPRARYAAIEAIAAVPDGSRERLFQIAAEDDDLRARELALSLLAQDPASRDRVFDLVEDEPDERLRTVGECTARLAAVSGAR